MLKMIRDLSYSGCKSKNFEKCAVKLFHFLLLFQMWRYLAEEFKIGGKT